MVGLGLIFLVLLLLDYSGTITGQREGFWLSRSLTVIWGIFLADFLLRFALAPNKQRFLKGNWLSAISLALPFLRPLRALRAVRAVRSLSLVRLLGGLNRGMRVLRRVTGGHQLAYLSGLTLVVVMAGAAGVWYFDRGVADSPISSFGDALWWSASMVTTINNEKFAVSAEARILAILLRIFAVSVFGFITATIATYLLGRDDAATDEASASDLSDQLEQLRREVSALRTALDARSLAARADMAGMQTHDEGVSVSD